MKRAPRNQTPEQRAAWLYENRTEVIPGTEFSGVPCRRWLGATNRHVPAMWWQGKKRNVTGFMRTYLLGIEQPEGTETCHSCQTVACAEPLHVRFGTHKENVHDSIAAGTHNSLTHPHAKLTNAQVLEIYRRAHTGEHQPSIAKDYGISNVTVSQIKTGLRWSSVTDH